MRSNVDRLESESWAEHSPRLTDADLQQLNEKVLPWLRARFSGLYQTSLESRLHSAIANYLASDAQPDNLAAWIYKIAERSIYRACSRQSCFRRVLDQIRPANNHLANVARAAAVEELAEFRTTLNQEQQAVFELKLQLLTHKEIAEKLCCTQSDVDSIWRSICRKARSQEEKNHDS